MVLAFMAFFLAYAGFACVASFDLVRARQWRHEMQVAADAGALAGASAYIDGTTGDIAARANQLVLANEVGHGHATIETLELDTINARLLLTLAYEVGPGVLMFAPGGITIRAQAGGKAYLVSNDSNATPVPNGNAWGWWKKQHKGGAAKDSARIALSR